MVARDSAPFSPLLPAPLRALVAAALGLAASCGGGEEPGSTTSPVPSPPANEGQSGPASTRAGRTPVTLIGEEAYDSAELGELHGTILFRGSAPARFELGAAASAECKHHPGVDQRSNVVVVEDGKLAGVFVALDSGIERARIPPAPDTPVTLEQKGCMYVPRVLGLRVGQLLRVTNGDPTNHNVHTRSKRNPPLNKSMGAQQPALEFRFEKPERPVPFACDIHPWMGAAVFVEEHPWFAVSDERGEFRIPAVPPGEYGIEATHETLGRVSGSVSVKAGRSTGFTLTLGK